VKTKPTTHGAVLWQLTGDLGDNGSPEPDGKRMGLRVKKTTEGVVRIKLLHEGVDGEQDVIGWVELDDAQLPHLMRVLLQ